MSLRYESDDQTAIPIKLKDVFLDYTPVWDVPNLCRIKVGGILVYPDILDLTGATNHALQAHYSIGDLLGQTLIFGGVKFNLDKWEVTHRRDTFGKDVYVCLSKAMTHLSYDNFKMKYNSDVVDGKDVMGRAEFRTSEPEDELLVFDNAISYLEL